MDQILVLIVSSIVILNVNCHRFFILDGLIWSGFDSLSIYYGCFWNLDKIMKKGEDKLRHLHHCVWEETTCIFFIYFSLVFGFVI